MHPKHTFSKARFDYSKKKKLKEKKYYLSAHKI